MITQQNLVSIYKDQYVDILIEPTKSLVVDIWNEKSEDMQYKDFINFTDAWIDIIESLHLKLGLSDATDMRFVVVPELQSYIGLQFKKVSNTGFQKHAVLLPPTDIFVQASIAQTIDEMNIDRKMVVSKTFENKEDAEKWLLN